MWGEGGGKSLRASLDPSQAETVTLCPGSSIGSCFLVPWPCGCILITSSFVGKRMGGLQLTCLLLMVHLQHLAPLMNIKHIGSSLKESTSVPDQSKHGPSSADQGNGAVGQLDKT